MHHDLIIIHDMVMRSGTLIVVLALGSLGALSWRAFTAPPPPLVDNPARLINAADLQVKTVNPANAMPAYVRAVCLNRSGAPQRIKAARTLWTLYTHPSRGPGATKIQLLFNIGNFLNVQNAPDLIYSEAPFWLGLAYAELADVFPGRAEALRWLDMASDQACLFKAVLGDLPEGALRLSDLHFLQGLISWRRRKFGAEPQALQDAVRNFSLAVGFDPKSARNRHALAATRRRAAMAMYATP